MDCLRHLYHGKTKPNESQLLLSDDVIKTDNLCDSTYVESTKHCQPHGYRNGWRSSVIWQIVLGISILILNLSLTIWCYATLSTENGVATFYRGSCAETKRMINVLHLAICILSSLLLGASNYCMQVLSAPTREEVDSAHARRKWLSIGVTSFKNLFHVDRKKTILYFILGFSSVPLHLLWNSAFVDTLTATEYVYSAVTESFLEGASWDRPGIFLPINEYMDEAQAMLDHYANDTLVRMNNTDCIQAYNVDFLTEYSNILLVLNRAASINGVSNSSLLLQGLNEVSGVSPSLTSTTQGEWMCASNLGCSHGQIARLDADHWNPWVSWGLDLGEEGGDPQNNTGGHVTIEGSIQYCLAEKPEFPCKLGISPPILLTVLICNAVKILCFIATLWIGGSTDPLLTNGDAIQSFLLQPDTILKARCLVSQREVKRNKKFWADEPLPIMWHGQRKFWASGATWGVWLATYIP